MKRLILLAIAIISVLTITLSAYGCTGLTDQQIVLKIIDTSNNVKSFKLGMDLSENVGNVSAKETGTASVNNVTKEMLMNNSIVMDSSPGGTQTDTMDEYLTGGYLYIKQNITGTDQWEKIKVDESTWTAEDQLAQLTEFLQSATSISRLDDETVNGLDCYVFQITPDMAEVLKWMQSQSQSNPELQNLNPDVFKSTTFKMWIDKKSFFPQKENIDLTMEITSSDIGDMTATTTTPGFDITMTMSGNITYTDYNVPVTIELPAAAQNAVEIPQP
ncbi:MAG: DUF6612 family protein [Dehalococcoidales bacterium]|jgi:hypothetical protein